MVKCHECGAKVDKEDGFCVDCGEKLNLCKKCGAELEEDVKFCPECGVKIKSGSEIKESKKAEKKNEEPEEETFECEFCGKEFPSEIKCLRHEKTCPEREEDVEPDEEEELKQVEVREVHHHHQTSGGGRFLKFIGYLLLIVIIVGAIIIVAALYGEVTSKGGIEQAIDPCLRARDNCYSSCGEGVLSTITFCKDRCDSDYRQCKGG